MYNKEYKYLIEIINNVLNKKETPYKEDIDYQVLYKVAKSHTLLIYLYYGLKHYNIPCISNLINKVYNENIYKTAVQEAEKELIMEAFEKNGIKHMPLKGSVIKYIYPSIDLRTMCDFDCLFDKSKAKAVKKIMQGLGYDVEVFNKSNHDVYKKKPFMNIEMHKELMGDSYKISKYYHTIWDNVLPVDNKKYEFKMTNEDFYIFMIAHLAKHYVSGGAGIRNFIDIYLFNKTYNDLNYNYINQELEKLGLINFKQFSEDLSLVWFEGKISNETLEKFESSIFKSGIYGTVDQRVAIDICFNDEEVNNLEESKFKYLIKRAFPSYKLMKNRNPILRKIPILLPFFYFTRCMKALFNFKSSKAEMKSIGKVSADTRNEIKELHDQLGVKKGL